MPQKGGVWISGFSRAHSITRDHGGSHRTLDLEAAAARLALRALRRISARAQYPFSHNVLHHRLPGAASTSRSNLSEDVGLGARSTRAEEEQ